MKRLVMSGLVVAVFSLLAGPALAQIDQNPPFIFDEILPVYKHASQKAVCMASCDDFGVPCNAPVNITFYDQNGNTLVTQTFPVIPNNGSRFVIYTGPQKVISCKITSPLLTISRIKRTVAVLDATWKTMALTSNDADTLFQ